MKGLIVNMEVSNLISLFPVIGIPVMALALFTYLFVHLLFSYSKSKKRNYFGYLHGEEIFKNIFNCKYT